MALQIAVVLARLLCDLLIFAAFGVAAVYIARRLARWAWSLRLKSRGELAKVAGYVALGPITGPLAARVVRHVRGGKPMLAALWALAIPLTWAGVASAATVLAHAVGH